MKPHVLMLTPYLPYPPNSGGRSRTYNLIRHLRDDYRITLVCFGRPEEQVFDLSPLRELCELVVVDRAPSPGTLRAAWLSFTSPRPVTMRLYRTPEMQRAVAGLLQERSVGLVHVESFYMLSNLPRHLDTPVLLSEPAIEYVAWRRHAQVAQPWYTRPGIALEALKMRLWEPRAWSEVTVVGVMSAIDATTIKKATPGVQLTLAPNGVDVDYFHIDETVPRDSHTAIYMGDYKYFPNTDAVLYFASEILPLIRPKRPDFRLLLLGKDAPPAIRALHDDPDVPVEVAGLVDDTRPYLQGSAVFICPLRSGSGTRFKLMEALACGCPVVSTTVGAEGLDAVDGEHMLLRDSPQAFADGVVELLANPARGQMIGQAGRRWVARHHGWAQSAALLRDAYNTLIGHEDPTIHADARTGQAFVQRIQAALEEMDESDETQDQDEHQA
ncbi:MAG: glycosyltransferase [Anaerolineae bacterium]|nr:glycosyltransferase [Anaerolineae bacterium]